MCMSCTTRPLRRLGEYRKSRLWMIMTNIVPWSVKTSRNTWPSFHGLRWGCLSAKIWCRLKIWINSWTRSLDQWDALVIYCRTCVNMALSAYLSQSDCGATYCINGNISSASSQRKTRAWPRRRLYWRGFLALQRSRGSKRLRWKGQPTCCWSLWQWLHIARNYPGRSSRCDIPLYPQSSAIHNWRNHP